MAENTRKRWKTWVACAIIGSAALVVAVHYLIEKSEAFKVASAFLRGNPEVIRLAGPIRDTSLSWGGGSIEVSGGSGRASLTVNLLGSVASPQAYVELTKRGVWEVSFARLLPESAPAILLKDDGK